MTRPRRSAALENQQPFMTVLDAVVVRFNDANGAAVAHLDKPPVRDGESNQSGGREDVINHASNTHGSR